ncbi:MAG: glutathione transferase [Deltaproteobacteria bacterium]|nr:glutathione transferase [Deltaproteobacteria bacterium]
MAPDLTLYADSAWMSPWVFHALVALEEKQLAYKLETIPLPIAEPLRSQLADKAILGKVPLLIHDGVWITESLAISEYLAERFPTPGNPRLFPADLVERARARQVMSWLRTSLMALRNDRPTSGVFGHPTVRPLSDKAKADADELVRVASRLVAPGKTQMFAEWSIADADLALCLMRMVAGQDHMPEHLVQYALAQWDRRSIKRFLAHVPTTP